MDQEKRGWRRVKLFSRARTIVGMAQDAIKKRKQDKDNATAAITALLELGTSMALKAAVKAPLSKHISFLQAIWNCERPEEAGIQLLRFRSTGRERVLACLRAFAGRIQPTDSCM